MAQDSTKLTIRWLQVTPRDPTLLEATVLVRYIIHWPEKYSFLFIQKGKEKLKLKGGGGGGYRMGYRHPALSPFQGRGRNTGGFISHGIFSGTPPHPQTLIYIFSGVQSRTAPAEIKP